MSEESNSEAQTARREVLRSFIDQHFGSINSFALALERKQPQLNETLKGERSFGEKLARSLEQEVDDLRNRAEWKHLPPLRFDTSGETHPKLAALIAFFEAIPTDASRDELIEIARMKANKSGTDTASTRVERELPAPGLGALQPRSKTAPKKRHRG